MFFCPNCLFLIYIRAWCPYVYIFIVLFVQCIVCRNSYINMYINLEINIYYRKTTIFYSDQAQIVFIFDHSSLHFNLFEHFNYFFFVFQKIPFKIHSSERQHHGYIEKYLSSFICLVVVVKQVEMYRRMST